MNVNDLLARVGDAKGLSSTAQSLAAAGEHVPQLPAAVWRGEKVSHAQEHVQQLPAAVCEGKKIMKSRGIRLE